MKVSKFGWLAALLAVAAVVGAVGFTPRTADAAVTAATKTCASTGTENQGICNLVITEGALAAGNVYTITINGPARFLQQLNPVLPAATTSDADCVATVTSFSATQIVVTLSGNANCTGAGTVTVQELVGLTGSGTVSQTVVGSGGTSGTITAQASGLPAFTANVVQSVVKECNIPAVPGRPAGTVIVNQPVSCTLSITFNEAPTAPVPGTVTVTNGTFQGPGGQTGTSFSFTCAAGSAFCGVAETVVPTTAGSVPTQNVAIGGSNFGNLTGGITAVLAANQGFVQGNNYVIRCPTALNPALANVPGLTPGEIGGATQAIAVGILPAALICEAVFTTTNADGTVVVQNVAPGTVEVSALSGSLVDLGGRLTTNLRIGCGSTASTTVVNDCQGVRFGVLGIGVGFVDIRARYEPSSAAAQAGIQEREATARVGFIAPAVSLNLLLTPNPIAVGATNGVATLRFNRNFFFGDTLLIDPTTGLPIAINFGSPLNGTVEFRIANTAIAAFTDVLTTTTGTQAGGATTVATAGTTATSGQAFVRCGGQTAVVVGGILSDFFGGCDQVTVGYRGVAAGNTQVSATFVPDLPNAFGATTQGVSNLTGLFNITTGIASNTVARNLEVVGAGPATTQRLVVGCNNVVAPANETVQQVAARVDPASAAVSIWKQVPGTTQFQGAPVGGNVPSGVANLSSVNALDAIFICVSAAATYRLT